MACQCQRNLVADHGIGFHQPHEVGAEEHRQFAVVECAGLGVTGRVIEQGQIAEEGTRPHFGHHFPPLRAQPADDHAAGHDQIQRLSFFAFIENDFIGQIAALVQQIVDDLQFERRERGKQGRIFQPLQARRQFG